MSILRGRSSSLASVIEDIAHQWEPTEEEFTDTITSRRGVSIPRQSLIPSSFSTFASRSDFLHHGNSPEEVVGSVPILIETTTWPSSPTTQIRQNSLGLSNKSLNSIPEEQQALLSTDGYEESVVNDSVDVVGAFKELKRNLRLAIPVAASYLLSYFAQSTLIFFVGRLGATQLAAASLAILFCNVLGYSMLVGLSTSLDTLLSQVSTAASDPFAIGWILQRALVMISTACIPLLCIWWFAGDILIALHQPEQEAMIAGELVRYLMPSLLPYGICECLKRFCQAQGIMGASTFSVFVTTLLNIPLMWFLVWSKWNVGLKGAAIAMDVVNWLNVFLLMFYIKFIDGSKAWGGWSRQALEFTKSSWTPMIKLALQGVLQVGSEWWAFEIASILAGLRSGLVLASQSVILTMTSFTFMLPLGISVASSLRVGSNLGARKPEHAQLAAIVAAVLGLVVGFVNMGVLLIFKDTLGSIFSKDPRVIDLVAKVLPMAAVFQVLDCLGGVCAGIIRGVGQQKISAILSAVGYYCLGLPLASWLCFEEDLGLKGIWLGLCGGLIVVALGQLAYIFRIDWQRASKIAYERVEKLVPGSSDIASASIVANDVTA